MSEQTLLYALSTLAQTCAALAAFVGALGVYRLQYLSNKHQDVERSLRGWLGVKHAQHSVYMEKPRQRILEEARNLVKSPSGEQEEKEIVQEIEEALKQWDGFDPDDRRCRRLLFVFELWNLIIILVALAGFNYVCFLSKWPWTTYLGLWVAAGGTVFVTVLMLLEISDFFARRALRRVRLKQG